MREYWKNLKTFVKQALHSTFIIKIGIAFGLSAILVAGQYLQIFVVSIITSDADSIYSSAYADRVILSLSLYQWLALSSNFVIASLAISFFSFRKDDVSLIFHRGIGVIFVSLMAIDLWGLSTTFELLVQNIVCNFIGAIILAAITILIAYGGDKIAEYFENYNSSVFWLVIWPVFAGVLVSSICFYITKTFLTIAPATVEFSVPLPLSAKYVSPSSLDGLPGGEKDFGLFVKPANIQSRLSWLGTNEGSFKFQWKKTRPVRVKASLQFFQGCIFGAKPEGEGEKLIFEDVNSASVNLDIGMTEFSFSPEGGTWHGITASAVNELNFFRVKKDSKTDNIEFNLDVPDNAVVSASNNSQPMNYYFVLNLLENIKGGSRKFINIEINKENNLFFFEPEGNLVTSKTKCSSLNTRLMYDNTAQSIFVSSPLVGGVLTVYPPKYSGVSDDFGEMSVTGVKNGFLAASANPGLPNILQDGAIRYFGSTGQITELYVNNIKIEVREIDSVDAYGELRAEMRSNGDLHITGQANSISKSGERLSKTRWEKLSWETRIIVLGGVPTVLLYFFSIFIDLQKKRYRLKWLGG